VNGGGGDGRGVAAKLGVELQSVGGACGVVTEPPLAWGGGGGEGTVLAISDQWQCVNIKRHLILLLEATAVWSDLPRQATGSKTRVRPSICSECKNTSKSRRRKRASEGGPGGGWGKMVRKLQ